MQLPLPVIEIGLNLHDELECIAGCQTVSVCFHPGIEFQSAAARKE